MKTTSKPEKAKDFNALTSRIETREQAEKVIKDTAVTAYVMAALQGVLGYFIAGPVALVDAVLYAAIGFALHKTKHVAAAIALFLLSLFAVFQTVSNMVGDGGGRNILLAGVMAYVSYRAVRATQYLRNSKN
jgi:hypothetical protein